MPNAHGGKLARVIDPREVKVIASGSTWLVHGTYRAVFTRGRLMPANPKRARWHVAPDQDVSFQNPDLKPLFHNTRLTIMAGKLAMSPDQRLTAKLLEWKTLAYLLESPSASHC